MPPRRRAAPKKGTAAAAAAQNAMVASLVDLVHSTPAAPPAASHAILTHGSVPVVYDTEAPPIDIAREATLFSRADSTNTGEEVDKCIASLPFSTGWALIPSYEMSENATAAAAPHGQPIVVSYGLRRVVNSGAYSHHTQCAASSGSERSTLPPPPASALITTGSTRAESKPHEGDAVNSSATTANDAPLVAVTSGDGKKALAVSDSSSTAAASKRQRLEAPSEAAAGLAETTPADATPPPAVPSAPDCSNSEDEDVVFASIMDSVPPVANTVTSELSTTVAVPSSAEAASAAAAGVLTEQYDSDDDMFQNVMDI